MGKLTATRLDISPELCEQAKRFFLLHKSGTNKDLANLWGITEKRLEKYITAHPELKQAMRDGKEAADANVAASLYERATGAVVYEDVVVGKGEDARVERLEKRLPPDTAAAFIWLKNRRPQDWRDRVETFNVDVKLDLVEYAKEYARRIGPAAAQRFLEDHGYKGRVIDATPEAVSED